jgi:hypothetical protein
VGTRELAQRCDDLPVDGLGAGDRRPFAPQEREVLGQRDETRAAPGRLADEGTRGGEVLRDVVAGAELDDGDPQRAGTQRRPASQRNSVGSMPVRRMTS